jgi:hypothetical protein
MVKANRGGQTGLCTKGNGRMVKPTVMASCTMQMAMSIRVTGSKIKQTDMEPTHMQTEQSTLAAGRTINSTDKVLKRGRTVLYTKVCTQKVKSMVTASLHLRMDQSMKEDSI